jgi:hypothetical protein
MTFLRHPVLGAVLALMLILTGQSLAVMRMAPGPAGEMVLCTGSGPVAVAVDENGQPVGPPHICPDCAMALFHAVGHSHEAAPRAQARKASLHHGIIARPWTAPSPSPQARGPPVLS